MDFKDLTREERKAALAELGEKPFREKQIFRWICSGAGSFAEMTDLSVSLRQRLSELYSFERSSIELTQRSADRTMKFLIAFPDGEKAEAVFMQYEYGNTLCISTQVGCAMHCSFCASGIGGKRRDLRAWEMLDEYLICTRASGQAINHIVLMGMGEPFDNYSEVSEFLRQVHSTDGIGLSYRNITLSTCGIVPKIAQFSRDFPQVGLAVSLHAGSQQEREKIMPVAKAYPLDQLIPACRAYTKETGRRISFEYALIKDRNDTPEKAEELIRLLKGINCHVNLIPLNPVEESGMSSTARTSAYAFAVVLEKGGIPCTVRRQLGADIDAACGQLRKKHSC